MPEAIFRGSVVMTCLGRIYVCRLLNRKMVKKRHSPRQSTEGEFHHRGTEDTKLRKDRKFGVSDLGNPLDGLSAPHNHFPRLGAPEDFIVFLRQGIQ